MAGLNAADFVNKLASDDNFRSQVGISSDMTLAEFQNKAAAAGFNFTSEEILAAVEAHESGALNEEALNQVSGGVVHPDIIGVKRA